MWLSRRSILVYAYMFSLDINPHDTIAPILYDLTYLTTGCVCKACVVGKWKICLSLMGVSWMSIV